MKRVAALALLAAVSISWLIPAKAQGTGVAEYAGQSRQADRKAARKQEKAIRKNMKVQQKAAKRLRKSVKS